MLFAAHPIISYQKKKTSQAKFSPAYISSLSLQSKPEIPSSHWQLSFAPLIIRYNGNIYVTEELYDYF